jgi:DNA-binding NarL/FixJ family response regulator
VPTIIDALQTILQGGVWTAPDQVTVPGARGNSVPPDEAAAARRVASLTPQQFRVLSMLCSGQSNKRIALQLQVSEATVKAHMTAIMRKLGCNNRTQVALAASQLALEPNPILPTSDLDEA